MNYFWIDLLVCGFRIYFDFLNMLFFIDEDREIRRKESVYFICYSSYCGDYWDIFFFMKIVSLLIYRVCF